MRVLLCSPLGGVAGGISRWTGKILDFYHHNVGDDKIVLEHFNTSRKHYKDIDSSGFSRVYWGVIDYFSEIAQFRKLIKGKQYDIVHYTSSGSFGLYPLLIVLRIAKRCHIKTIVHFRFGRIPELYNKQNWEFRLIKKVLNVADAVIVLDKSTYKVLTSLQLGHIYSCPNPVSQEVIDYSMRGGVQREYRKIVFAGHLIPSKGIYELIEACTQIPDVEVCMAGWCPEDMHNTISQMINKNEGTTRFHLLGQLSFEDTIKEMLSASVFVLPTYTEGFPNVILEAMACGCPIVTTDVGAIPEMLDIENGNNCGICVKPKDVVGLRRGIEKMLNDTMFAKSCGYNAQKRVMDLYTMPKVWDKLVTIWQSVV